MMIDMFELRFAPLLTRQGTEKPVNIAVCTAFSKVVKFGYQITQPGPRGFEFGIVLDN